MNYEQLANVFKEYADNLSTKSSTSKSSTSKSSSESNNTIRFRVNAYNRVANLILSKSDITEKVTNASIDKLNISDYMKNKAKEFIKKKKVSNNEQNLMQTLSQFMGLGTIKAKKLIDAGLTSISQLKLKKYKNLLPEETRIFLELKPLQRIPREDIKLLEPFINNMNTDTEIVIITGSYRREKPFSSDIDVMLVSDNENAIDDILKKLKSIKNLKVYPYSKGLDKMSLIIDMTKLNRTNTAMKKLIYKMDIFKTSEKYKVPMLLYSTGSKEFNVRMRSRAKKMGYLLNQKGLFKDGILIENLNSEEDYFAILNMKYLHPKDRI